MSKTDRIPHIISFSVVRHDRASEYTNLDNLNTRVTGDLPGSHKQPSIDGFLSSGPGVFERFSHINSSDRNGSTQVTQTHEGHIVERASITLELWSQPRPKGV